MKKSEQGKFLRISKKIPFRAINNSCVEVEIVKSEQYINSQGGIDGNTRYSYMFLDKEGNRYSMRSLKLS